MAACLGTPAAVQQDVSHLLLNSASNWCRLRHDNCGSQRGGCAPAQVALLAGLDITGVEELRVGPSHGGQHLHNLLKFLTMRSEKGATRSGITLVGGPHDPALDGPACRFYTSHAHQFCFPDAQRGWHSAGPEIFRP